MSFKSNSPKETLSKTFSTKFSSTDSPKGEIIFEQNAFLFRKLQAFDIKFAENEFDSEPEYEDEEYDKSFPQDIIHPPKLHYKVNEIAQISTLSI